MSHRVEYFIHLNPSYLQTPYERVSSFIKSPLSNEPIRLLIN